MYYDDPYNPTLENDYDSVSQDSSTTANTFRQKQRNNLDSSKKADKGYHKIKRIVDGKKNSFEIYNGYLVTGSSIRNALTGTKYEHYKIGTRDEDLLFKVKYATSDKGMNREHVTLFYDNPEHFERHTKTVVSIGVKSVWLCKYNAEKSRRADE